MSSRLSAVFTRLFTGPARLKTLITIAAVVLATTTGLVVRAAVDGGGENDTNVAVAVNTKDDSEVVKLRFKVSKTQDDPSDPANAAVAVSSCENCRTIAIAIQAVIVLDDPEVISPTNIALAVNENCTLCETYADARQHVITTDGPAKFSAEGKARIKAIREEVKAIRQQEKDGDIPFDELKSRVDALSAELADILADEFRASSAAAPDISPTPMSTDSADGASSSDPDATSEPDTTGTPDSTSATPSPDPNATPMETPSTSPGL
jgi:hypothetical protein